MTTLAIIIFVLGVINLLYVLIKFVFIKGILAIMEAINKKREEKRKRRDL